MFTTVCTERVEGVGAQSESVILRVWEGEPGVEREDREREPWRKTKKRERDGGRERCIRRKAGEK